MFGTEMPTQWNSLRHQVLDDLDEPWVHDGAADGETGLAGKASHRGVSAQDVPEHVVRARAEQ
jgi:hypothetical protein